VGCIDSRIERRYGERGKKLYSICDVATSVENMLLLAYEQGLGSCWVGAFDEKKVSRILNLTGNLRPIAIVPIGFSAEKPLSPPRVSKTEAMEILK